MLFYGKFFAIGPMTVEDCWKNDNFDWDLNPRNPKTQKMHEKSISGPDWAWTRDLSNAKATLTHCTTGSLQMTRVIGRILNPKDTFLASFEH